MKRLVSTLTLAAVLALGTSQAFAVVDLSSKNSQKKSRVRAGVVVSDRAGVVVSDRAGVVVSD